MAFRGRALPQNVSWLIVLCMKLRLVLEHDSDTNRWAAFFPELPGCASAGDSEEEAVQNAKEALELWFEPSPRQRLERRSFSKVTTTMLSVQ
jgi:predicted RNase H-like HicB family nuclease